MFKDKIFKAFTLIELVVAITLIGIMSTISFSSFASFRESNKISQQAQQIYGILSSSFSNSRNQSKYFQVQFSEKNEQNILEIFSCEELENEKCPTGNSIEKVIIEDFIKLENVENLFVTFTPPHGDLSWKKGSSTNTENKLLIKIIGGKKTYTIKLHSPSSLIEFLANQPN